MTKTKAKNLENSQIMKINYTRSEFKNIQYN